MTIFVIGVLLLALASAWDLYTTKRAVVDNPMLFREANPIMAAVLRRTGVVGMGVVKGALLALVITLGVTLDAFVAAGASAVVAAAATAWVARHNRSLFYRKLR